HSPTSGKPVISLSHSALAKHLEGLLKQPRIKKQEHLYLAAPLIRGRKGHHEPIAKWVEKQGYTFMRIDGSLIEVAKFKKLSRYKEHDIEVVLADLGKNATSELPPLDELLKKSLRLGKGSAMLVDQAGEVLTWLSTERVDPETGEAYPELDPKHFSWNSSKGWCPECRGNGNYWTENEDEESDRKWSLIGCNTCGGERLNLLSRNVYLNFNNGTSLSLPGLLKLPPAGLLDRLNNLKLDRKGKAVVTDIIPQIEERLQFMGQVGLDYLSMDRPTSTLSGGEAQRIRLAAQLGSNLSGVLYVLDEPSIGLHARDNQSLIQSLKELKARGNTLLVVEHDDETMEQADRIIDIGPGAGVHGGEIIANGPIAEIRKNKQSLTGEYLHKGIKHPIRGSYRKLPPAFNARKRKEQDWLVLKNPRLRNLKGDELRIPLSRLTMVGGISGAGKSTLIRDLLHPVVDYARKYGEKRVDEKEFSQYVEIPNTHEGKPFDQLVNGDRFRAVIEVDQKPIGKTPRSTPATYMGAMDIIRKFFANLPEAKMRGMNASTFSFNTAKGRCETCKGSGQIKLEMNFLPDAYMTCEDCNGTRYGPELNDITWKGKTISGILDMSFEEAAEFFKTHSQLSDMLGLMVQTGLGYLTLGQSSPTLSGGEAQRLKLVSELAKGLPSFRDKSRAINFQNLYILEEPTIGLHM
ncbi:MAG: excinuclease ABC subunit A, partial [Verrucomicrobiae bacterium]|nr:excinuclease ABC subunit A [Verrucomicrobiae bacterium]